MSEQKPMSDQSMLWGHAIAFWDVWGVRAMIAGAVLGFLALAFSLFSSFVLYRVADQAQAELKVKTAVLSSDLEHQKTLTAQATVEQERLKAELAWRTLTPEQAMTFVNALAQSPFSVRLEIPGGDNEAAAFAKQLTALFERARWKVTSAPIIFSDAVLFGLYVPGEDKGATKALRTALLAAKIDFSINQPPSATRGRTMLGNNVGADVDLFIGSKPLLLE